MKKKIIYSSALAVLFSASSVALAGGPEIIMEPNYFDGFYIGGTGAVHHNTFNGSSQVVLQDDVNITPVFSFITIPASTFNANTVSGGEFDGFGGLQGGFGRVFNHQFYVGIQGFGEWGTSSEQDTQSRNIASGDQSILGGFINWSASRSASSTTTVKIENDYGFAGKFGYLVAPRSMVYGKVGASWANISVTNNVDAQANLNVSSPGAQIGDDIAIPSFALASQTNLSGATSGSDSNKLGLLLGVGFEQFVYRDVVSLNVEYDYVNYGSVKAPAQPIQGQNTTSVFVGAPVNFDQTFVFPIDTKATTEASGDVKVSTLLAGLNFYFGNDWI